MDQKAFVKILHNDKEKAKRPKISHRSSGTFSTNRALSKSKEKGSHCHEDFLSEAINLFFLWKKSARKKGTILEYKEEKASLRSDTQKIEQLFAASKKFKRAHLADPQNGEILQRWGCCLTLLGQNLKKHHYFIDAREKHELALNLGHRSLPLFWGYAVALYYIGLQSGEAYDLQKGIQYFEKGVKIKERLPAGFWSDFGATSLLLSNKIESSQPLMQAVNCFKHAISIEPENPLIWYGLAKSLSSLYVKTHEEVHFSQGDEAFSYANKLSAKIDQNREALSIEWGQFLLLAGKRTRSPKHLRHCLEKCHDAPRRKNPLNLAIWGEALSLLGELTDRLDLIYEGEKKILEALEIEKKNPDIWHALGMCYNAFGTYFSDYDYHYQAIEKFQSALSLDRTQDRSWHAIGATYSIISQIEEDPQTLAQGFKFYEKAIDLNPKSERYVSYAQALAKMGEMTQDEHRLQKALSYFEIAFSIQKNAVYLHPEWLFSYASTLDLFGNFEEEDDCYTKAIEIFSHVLMIDPFFPQIHHRIAQTFCHLGELSGQTEHFYRAIHHLRLALKDNREDDSLILDWGIALINIAQHTPMLTGAEDLLQEAREKLTLAAKMGNSHAYYQISCLYSITYQYDEAIFFLNKAYRFQGLPSLEDLLADDWLDGLRCTSAFQDFLATHPHLQEDR